MSGDAQAQHTFPMKNFAKGVMLISSICHYGNKQNSAVFKKINQKKKKINRQKWEILPKLLRNQSK